MKDGRHTIFSPYSQVYSFFVQVTASIAPLEFGAEATGGHAPSIGEET